MKFCIKIWWTTTDVINNYNDQQLFSIYFVRGIIQSYKSYRKLQDSFLHIKTSKSFVSDWDFHRLQSLFIIHAKSFLSKHYGCQNVCQKCHVSAFRQKNAHIFGRQEKVPWISKHEFMNFLSLILFCCLLRFSVLSSAHFDMRDYTNPLMTLLPSHNSKESDGNSSL